MSIIPLSELIVGRRDCTINVYVSRLWQHRGGTDDGLIKHTDIVFQDTQGNHMYGEIPQGLVNQFIERIREGKVYELKRFLVDPKKNFFKPVDGLFMLKLGRYTYVREITDSLMDHPLCTYALTALDDLPSPSDLPGSFTDVIGIITGVSPTTQYHSANRTTPSTKRVIYLSNASGYQISVVLWGERAIAFDGEGVLQTAAKGPVVVIFVGTLVKPFEGRRGLSGSAPCRWYINEDLPEINELHAQLKDKIPAVQGILLPGQSAAEISAQVDFETKTLKELKDLNIWDHAKTKFYCTVVFTKLSPGQRFWFSACTTCNKGTVPYGTAYKCPHQNCGGTGAMPRYRACFIGSDETADLEFVFFDKTGKELIGKPVLTLLRSKAPHGVTLDDAIQFARTDQSTPRELAAIVSRKYRLVVSVTTKSFDAESENPSYQVHRIDMQYGKQPRSSTTHNRPGLALASSSNSSASGLNSIGKALAEQVIIGRNSSSDMTTDHSIVTVSANVGSSSVTVGTLVPSTPPSVVKPTEPIDGNFFIDSTVKKALFQDLAPGVKPDDQLELAPRVESEEVASPVVDDAHTLPASVAAAPGDKRRRPLSVKAQSIVDGQSKKKKS